MLPVSAYKRETKPVGAFRDKTSIRRSRLLEEQSRYRKSFFEKLRSQALEALLQHAADDHVVDSIGSQDKKAKKLRRRNSSQTYAPRGCPSVSKQLVIPDFLVDVPADLASEWLAYLRPEGQRVVLISSGGRCCVFNKNGFFIESFATALPATGCTILDGVMVTPPKARRLVGTGTEDPMEDPTCWSHGDAEFSHPCLEDQDRIPISREDAEDKNCRHYSVDGRLFKDDSETMDIDESPIVKSRKKKKQKKASDQPDPWFSICDCICWNDCSIADSSSECRYFMLKSRFDELKESLETVTSCNRRRLRLVDVVDARVDELARLHYYSHSPEMISDSIIFVHKEAIYTPGISQLYLCWRDFTLSRFPIDTNDETGETIPFYQQANLLLRLKDAVVLTEDRVVVARLNKDNLQQQLESLPSTIYLTRWMKGKIKDELLIRVSISGLALESLPDETIVNVGECSATDLLIGMEIIGTPSPKRVRADTLNRIIHQFVLRQFRIRQHAAQHSAASLFNTKEEAAEENNNKTETPVFTYNGPLIDFEVILKCAATGESHSRMLLLRGERNLEEFLDDPDQCDNSMPSEEEERLEDWC